MDQEIFIKWELIEHDDNRKHYHRFIVRVPKLKDLSPHAINFYFGIQIKELELFEINGFLDFHFSHYKGGKENFFMFIEHSLINLDLFLKAKIEKNKSKNVDDEFQRSGLQEYDRFIEIQKICKDWIERKKLGLSYESKNGSENFNLDTKIQLLIMHYMGMLVNDYGNNTKFSELISRIINRGKNVRHYLTYINANLKKDYGKINPKYRSKTKDNLKVVYDLFHDLGFNELAKKVNADLEEIEKKSDKDK